MEASWRRSQLQTAARLSAPRRQAACIPGRLHSWSLEAPSPAVQPAAHRAPALAVRAFDKGRPPPAAAHGCSCWGAGEGGGEEEEQGDAPVFGAELPPEVAARLAAQAAEDDAAAPAARPAKTARVALECEDETFEDEA